MGDVPGAKGISESFSELVTDGLGDESHRHLTEANVEVQGAGAFPTEMLIGIEEFLDMPALWVMDSQVDDLVAIAGSQEGFMVEFFGVFSGTLDKLAVGDFGVFLEVKRAMSGRPSGPPGLKLLLRDGFKRSG